MIKRILLESAILAGIIMGIALIGIHEYRLNRLEQMMVTQVDMNEYTIEADGLLMGITSNNREVNRLLVEELCLRGNPDYE